MPDPAPQKSPSGSPQDVCDCPIDTAFIVLGRKWTVQILRNFLQGDRHFNELLASIRGINPKSLSQRLRELEEHGLITKRVTSKSPLRIEYELTERGYGLYPVLRSMARWSLIWAPEKLFTGGKRPADVDTCLEAWQARLVELGRLDLERGPDVVAVALKRKAAKR